MRPTGYIYGILDKDGSVAYVGQTKHEPWRRHRQHLRDAGNGSNAPVHLWMASEMASGRVPGMRVLEQVYAGSLLARERHWIDKLASKQTIHNVAHNPAAPRVTPSPIGPSDSYCWKCGRPSEAPLCLKCCAAVVDEARDDGVIPVSDQEFELIGEVNDLRDGMKAARSLLGQAFRFVPLGRISRESLDALDCMKTYD